jgi:hypothetical protein
VRYSFYDSPLSPVQYPGVTSYYYGPGGSVYVPSYYLPASSLPPYSSGYYTPGYFRY